MLSDYDDIKKRIKDPVIWYDTNGVPRYDKYHPSMNPNIYASESILYKIKCQACKEEFIVQDDWHEWVGNKRDISFSQLFEEQINNTGSIDFHYGDPPIHCCVGDTMNCEDIELLEFWYRDNIRDWKRNPKYEVRFNEPIRKSI